MALRVPATTTATNGSRIFQTILKSSTTTTTTRAAEETFIGRTRIVGPLQQLQQLQQQHRRSYWQEVVRFRIDPKDGKKRYEDPERVAGRFQEQVRSDGQALMDIYAHNDRHEKAWMKRKRLANKKRYEINKKQVLDLAKYIEFVKDNK